MNIFVFTASNKDAQKHLKDTIENPIKAEVIEKYLEDENDKTKLFSRP